MSLSCPSWARRARRDRLPLRPVHAEGTDGSELRRALFAPDQPAVVRCAPGVGVVAVVRNDDDGYVRLLLLDPARRGRGLGHELLRAAEDDLDDARVITVGADPPYFLFPGSQSRRRACAVCSSATITPVKRPTTTSTSISPACPPDPGIGGRAPSRASARSSSGGWPGTGRTGRPR